MLAVISANVKDDLKNTIRNYTGGKMEHVNWSLFKLFTRLLKHSVESPDIEDDTTVDSIITFFVTHLFWPHRFDVPDIEIEARKKFINYILGRSSEI